jgi:glycosyltransferase involved in cell wall biosynthesis
VQIGNGTSFRSAPIVDKSDALVIVGKIEKRKRQYELWQYALANNLEIHFLGPIEDTRVLEHLNRDPKLKEYFKGPKNREELARELPRYRALILLSAGEADALVLYEAQIAGLEIITNRDSLGNQDAELPWIHLITDEQQLKDTVRRITNNPADPIEIANYATKNYGWETRIIKLLDLGREFS